MIIWLLLWPSDAIWRQISGSTLAQGMTCCLTAQSHHLNRCWLIISKVEWHSSKGNSTRDTSAINHWNYMKKTKYLKCHSNFPGASELMHSTSHELHKSFTHSYFVVIWNWSDFVHFFRFTPMMPWHWDAVCTTDWPFVRGISAFSSLRACIADLWCYRCR